MAENVINQIARQLYAMTMKRKEPDFAEAARNGKYQRTFTDEYPFAKKPRAGFRRVLDEQKKLWAELANRG